jgi:hypothetical protein
VTTLRRRQILLTLALAALPAWAAAGCAGNRARERALLSEHRVEEVLADVAAGVYRGTHADPHPLAWEDIPALLALSDRTDRIARPVNSDSSILPPRSEARLEVGTIALYLVEGIRRGEKFPTLTILRGRASDKDLPRRAAAYWGWWDAVSKMPRSDARKVDPLRGTGLSWP